MMLKSTKVKSNKELKPHTTNLDSLKKASKVYAQNKTPEYFADGRVTGLDVKPGGPELAAIHLREIHKSYSDQGVQHSIRGLQITRGNQYVLQMMKHGHDIKGIITGIQKKETGEQVSAPVSRVLKSNNSGTQLTGEMRDLIRYNTNDDPGSVRVHDNPAAHSAADSIGAKAFTVGHRIFFGKGQYKPNTRQGKTLLSHEIAHTYQQNSTSQVSADNLSISTPDDQYEQQANQFAESVMNSQSDFRSSIGESKHVIDAVSSSHRGSHIAPRIQRAISFTAADGVKSSSNMSKNETAAGFQLRSVIPSDTFKWTPEVTISGNAGDAFAEWETAHHQVVKSKWQNIWWGTGRNRTHRRYFINGAMPQRDTTAVGNAWYSDWRAQSFSANGDVKKPVLRDGPRTGVEPWDNPMPARNGNSGWFNYGEGFVATLSARHTPTGTGANAFRHLSHVHWNFGIGGTFNANQALGSRVNITTGGRINSSAVIAGVDRNNTPIHGGGRFTDNWSHVDT